MSKYPIYGFCIAVSSFSYYAVRAYIRKEALLPEWFPLGDIADMHFYHRHIAFLYRVS